MAKDKWSQSKNIHDLHGDTIKKTKQPFNDPTDLDLHSILKHLEMMQMQAAINGSYDLCKTLTKNIYDAENITVVKGFQTNNQHVKSELHKMYSQLEDQYESLKKQVGTDKVIDKTFSDFDSFDDFYDNFKEFTLFLEDNPSNDISKIASYAHEHGDQLNENLLLISLAVHLVHEHRHQHIRKKMPVLLSCGHKLDPKLMENIKFCPTCGTKIK